MRWTSAPTAVTVLPALALASEASLPSFSTASALRPMRSITGPSCAVTRAPLSKVRAALVTVASSVSLRAARVRDTVAISASALLKALRFSTLSSASILLDVLSSLARTLVSTFSNRADSEGLVRITGYCSGGAARSGGESRVPPPSST